MPHCHRICDADASAISTLKELLAILGADDWAMDSEAIDFHMKHTNPTESDSVGHFLNHLGYDFKLIEMGSSKAFSAARAVAAQNRGAHPDLSD